MSLATTSAPDFVAATRRRDFTMWQIAVIGLCFWTLVFLLPR
jgi:hypothetical protein